MKKVWINTNCAIEYTYVQNLCFYATGSPSNKNTKAVFSSKPPLHQIFVPHAIRTKNTSFMSLCVFMQRSHCTKFCDVAVSHQIWCDRHQPSPEISLMASHHNLLPTPFTTHHNLTPTLLQPIKTPTPTSTSWPTTTNNNNKYS